MGPEKKGGRGVDVMLPKLISSLGSTKTTRGKLQDAVGQRGVDGVRDGDDGTATSASGAVEKMGERARASGVAAEVAEGIEGAQAASLPLPGGCSGTGR